MKKSKGKRVKTDGKKSEHPEGLNRLKKLRTPKKSFRKGGKEDENGMTRKKELEDEGRWIDKNREKGRSSKKRYARKWGKAGMKEKKNDKKHSIVLLLFWKINSLFILLCLSYFPMSSLFWASIAFINLPLNISKVFNGYPLMRNFKQYVAYLLYYSLPPLSYPS